MKIDKHLIVLDCLTFREKIMQFNYLETNNKNNKFYKNIDSLNKILSNKNFIEKIGGLESYYNLYGGKNVLNLLLENGITNTKEIEETPIFKYLQLITQNYGEDTYSKLKQKLKKNNFNFNQEIIDVTSSFLAPIIAFQNEIEEDINALNLSIFESQSILNSFINIFNKYIKDNLEITLLNELHSFLKNNPKQRNIREQIELFKNELNSSEGVSQYLSNFPISLSFLYHSHINFKKYFKSITNNYITNKREIYETFNLPNNSEISSIIGPLGDLHNDNKFVCEVKFNCGTKIIYKPRALNNELFFQEFCEVMFGGLNLNFHKHIVLSYPDHGWMEFVTYQECQLPEQVNNFYHKQGILLSILYFFGSIDITADNIIANGDSPVYIDLECLFTATKKIPEVGKNKLNFAHEILNDSVIRTGLLPFWSFAKLNNQGQNVAGIAKAENIQLVNYYKWVIKNDTSIELELIIDESANSRNNLPSINNCELSIKQYSQEFISGFSKGYNYFSEHSKIIIDELNKISNSIENRVLMRHTFNYDTVLKESFKPEYFKDNIKRSILFDHFLGIYDELNFPFNIILSEINQLQNFDIPYFVTKLNSTNLYDSNNNIICENYFKNSPIENIVKRINSNNLIDLNRQIDFIKRSLLVFDEYENNYKNLRDINSENSPKLKNNKLVFKKFAEEIGNKILNESIQDGASIAWIDINANRFGNWEQSVKPLGIYDGTDGIALFLLELYSVTQKEIYLNNAISIAKNSLFELKNIDNYQHIYLTENLTPLQFPLSTAFILEKVNLITKSIPNYEIKFIRDFIKKWVRIHMVNDSSHDFIKGLCGTINFLLNYFELTKEKEFLDLAVECGNSLCKNSISNDTGTFWESDTFKKLGGFAHGTSSYSFVLFKLSKLSKNNYFYQIALDVLRYDRSLYSESEGKWIDMRNGKPSNFCCWCHGASGILLSRILIRRYYPELIPIEELVLLKNQILELGFKLNNHSVCHGQFGNLIILQELAIDIADSELNKLVNQHAALLIQDIHENISKITYGNTENDIDMYGLYMGLSGIGHCSLKLFNNNIKSLFTLEFN
jgi:type 2 lantibiotic biosynthesis protein LanM